MCPNHVEHDLRHLDPVEKTGYLRVGFVKSRRVRRPKKAKIVDTYSKRGHANNGLIEVASDTGDSFEFEEIEDGASITRLPAHGIKLDFIDKAKRQAYSAMPY